MSLKPTFTCFLIGGDSLLMECGEVLLARGDAVRGVVTAAPRVRDWARGKGLPVVDAKSDYAAVLARQPFDWLFSITHLALIPEAALKLPAQGAQLSALPGASFAAPFRELVHEH